MPREAPYNRLKRICAQWACDNVLFRHKQEMWTLNLKDNTYDLTALSEKIRTADDLGYVIELSASKNDHVVFSYVKKLPEELPYELR